MQCLFLAVSCAAGLHSLRLRRVCHTRPVNVGIHKFVLFLLLLLLLLLSLAFARFSSLLLSHLQVFTRSFQYRRSLTYTDRSLVIVASILRLIIAKQDRLQYIT
jgi:hypothetical protein